MIIKFPGTTTVDIDPDEVLKGAIGEVKSILIVGKDKDDRLYLASSDSMISELLFLLKQAELAILENGGYINDP